MNVSSINNNKYLKSNSIECKQNFKGGSFLDIATKGLQMCDKYPMIGVAVTDSVATDVPRTIFDLVKTGVPAAMETMRREFSGLFVNCLMPSFVVLGVAKLLNNLTIAKTFKGVDMSSSWADSASIDKFVAFFKESIDHTSDVTTKGEIKTYFNKILTSLNGRDGDKWVRFSDVIDNQRLDSITETLTNLVFSAGSDRKTRNTILSGVAGAITDLTHAGEILSFDNLNHKQFGSNISELLRDSVDVASKFMNKSVRTDLGNFSAQAKKLINQKSLLGLGIIIPLAMSVQSINRAITRHKYKQKGAPIYKDFGKENTYQEMNSAQKAGFFSKKLLAAGAMVSLALLSMMKKPSLSMFQFKGMFPTLDQCRWIATATFVSRIFASEDPNELRESTVRDMASFAGLYFLGDYAGKAAASLIEKVKPDVKLLNRLGDSGKSASSFTKAIDWVKNTTLKSFDEVLPKDKNMRSICQLVSLGFSIISLGVLLPAYNRRVTEKKVALQKQLEAEKQQNLNSQSKRFIIELQNEPVLGDDGVYSIVAQDCFK